VHFIHPHGIFKILSFIFSQLEWILKTAEIALSYDSGKSLPPALYRMRKRGITYRLFNGFTRSPYKPRKLADDPSLLDWRHPP
jgi:hypothetical protein